ncbi:hypothetical protein EMEDMD4_490088 [Sinorhizobium medicae]|uniref:Uncharacterized protein n=1 Tax=Sinorhizobium medicae TaxID=110321 RepID=A0A508X2L7_9HYPH|nr:hypothetical protein EMEDMD4_490088 [Sinorhizobium medicae]
MVRSSGKERPWIILAVYDPVYPGLDARQSRRALVGAMQRRLSLRLPRLAVLPKRRMPRVRTSRSNCPIQSLR